MALFCTAMVEKEIAYWYNTNKGRGARMKIQGVNLGEQEVEYRLLSEYPFFKGKEQEVVKKL